jgi:hypothetical protein
MSFGDAGALGAGDYIAGAIWFAAIFGAVGFATVTILRRRFRALRGAELAVAGFILVYALIVATHVLPAVLGILSRPAVLIAALAAAGISALIPRAGEAAREDPLPAGGERRASWAIAAVAAIAVAAWLLAAASGRAPNPISATDMATSDLPMIGRWLQSGSIWAVHEFVPLISHGSYPHNGDVMVLAAVLPWESDFPARLANYAVLPMVGVSVYALGRRLGAQRPSAVTFGALATALPILTFATIELSMPDVVMFPAFVGGCLFLLRHFGTGATSDLVLAGTGLGLAFGSKWYGVTTVAIVLVVWAAFSLLARRPGRQVLRQGTVLSALTLAWGGVWLVRNLVAYDNPLFPVRVEPFGISLFDAPVDSFREEAGASLAGRLGEWAELGDLGSPLREAFGIPGLLLTFAVIAIAVAVVASARRRRDAGGTALLAGAVAAIGILVAYALTPYTAGPDNSTVLAYVNSRYAIPGLLIAAACCAAAARWPRLRIALELAALVAIVDGLAQGIDAARGRVAGFALVLVLVVLAARALGPRGWTWARRPAFAVPAAAAVLLLAVAGGYRMQETLAENRYDQDPSFGPAIAGASDETRVGIAGLWRRTGPAPVLAMFGPRFENEVEIVGTVEDGFIRTPTNRADWTRRVREGNYDLLLVGQVGGPLGREKGWAERLGAEPVAASDRFILYAL